MAKASEAQLEANRRYRAKNKEKERVASYRRTARLFINDYADENDLEEFRELLAKRDGTLRTNQKK
ncbi:hypothetical protein [Listeria booriae]|uniref:hypothetical protein n=1 Tax=Listeria booriae TaxID=1552123 RepID=UPI00162904FA|nr:hypothetical protein [Listeria booriae]MBC2069324.1 hypothetical protein [Listeria booriae]MBC6301522.1 hypothetical protein [Listeria booriae]